MDGFDVIIVGTGHGGAQAALALRQQGFSGSIAMIGKDPDLPYERPPLSKDYLSRAKSFDRILIRPPQFWADKDIEVITGVEVTAVDPGGKCIALCDGRSLAFGHLVWSAGGAARRLACPGAELTGVYAVRDRSDADSLMHELDTGARRVAIIGGGYIGLEAAAVLIKLGCQVTVIEALDRVLSRVAGTHLSAFFEAEHRSHGVNLLLDAQVSELEGEQGRVTGVRLSDGRLIACDMVIVGVGIVPAVAPLVDAGAKASNGVEVDEFCRTSLPDIFAIGDCAAHANDFAEGRQIRLESVQNANDMASTCAKAICGSLEPYVATPWFWSNQFDLKLQTVGLSQGFDDAVVRGSIESRSFSVIYLRAGQVIALDCVNAVRDYVQGRKLVEAKACPDPALLADTDIALKDIG